MKTLLLDNYDSFTYNLFQYLGELQANPFVMKNDEITEDEDAVEKMLTSEQVTHIVLSPGPGNPNTSRDIGISRKIIDIATDKSIPLLGVCLGHQALGVHFGSNVTRAPVAFHGESSCISVDTNTTLFSGLQDTIEVMRYHSLHVTEIPTGFMKTSSTDDGIIMAMQHVQKPLFGIQFHPESIGTTDGKNILSNFIHV